MPEFYGDSLFQAMEKQPVEVGSLLIAAPDVEMGEATRTVHLVISHENGHTMSLILNQRRDDAIANILPQIEPITAPPKALYTGGYYARPMVRTLGVLKPGVKVEEALEEEFIYVAVSQRVVILDGAAPVEKIGKWISAVRLFTGEVTWENGELQREIDLGRWFVTESLASDVIAGKRVDLWAEALRRLPLPLPLFATVPLRDLDN